MKHAKLQRRLLRKERRVVSGGTTRLLKPEIIEAESMPEEMTAKPDASLKPIVNDHNASNDASGVLRLDRSSRLPTALAEASEHDEHGWLPSGLVITITLLAIVLITIITWFISQMPSKP